MLTFTPRSVLAAFCVCLAGVAGAEPLPRPVGLEPDIAFWRQVFAEVSSFQVVVHDNRHLSVVYETFDLPPGISDSRRRELVDQAKTRYERMLLRLASTPRDRLSAEERRVLALWPPNISNDGLREAAGRVRTQRGLADRFQDGLVRSGLWQDHIRVQLRQAGVPESLAALPHVESSFDPTAGSYAGAVGLWQFTAPTGRRFMQVNEVVDERRDPFRSSEAAARLLRANYAELGTWPLAITAYNHGPGGVRRAVRTMGTDDIEVIVRRYTGPAFGFASRNFYVSFLAAEEVERRAQSYFGPVERARPEDHAVIVLPHYVRVDALERSLGVPRDTLRSYNPALRPAVWSGEKYVPRGFSLRVPAGLVQDSPDALLAAIPASERRSQQVPSLTHRVKAGESLSVIARRHGTTVSRLAAANGLTEKSVIRVGQELKLPGTATASAPTPAPATPAAAAAGTYTVRPGDSLAVIARRTGVSQRQLMAWNELTNPNRIYPGQRLRLAPASEEG